MGSSEQRCRWAHGLCDGVATASVAALLCLLALCLPQPASAQAPLECGEPVTGFVRGDDVDVFEIDVAAGTVGFVQSSFLSGPGDETLRIRITGGGLEVETCSNVADFVAPGGVLKVEVSPCFKGDGGNYLLNFYVISSSDEHCGRLLECGATPDGLALGEAGEIDSFRFPGAPGVEVEISIDDLGERDSPYLMRVFDPKGAQVGRVCGEHIAVPTGLSGDYTVLISSCGSLSTGDYRLERFDRRCPRGPVITTMALLPQSGQFFGPDGHDSEGRPVYNSLGVGTLIVEGRMGDLFQRIGDMAFTPGELPDLQAIVSQPLGDGNPAVCDQSVLGGIAATVPFGFRADSASIARINDLGCRVDDGQGFSLGRTDPFDSCVVPSFSFADPTTEIQFCAPIPNAESFPPGDTIVAARMRAEGGTLGAIREIVVRVPVGPSPTTTPTATPMPATATPTRTPTRRATTPPVTRPPGPCTSDCDGNGRVRISELTRCVRMALGGLSVVECRRCDRDGDGNVAIGELIEGVRNALDGCPPESIDQ